MKREIHEIEQYIIHIMVQQDRRPEPICGKCVSVPNSWAMQICEIEAKDGRKEGRKGGVT